MKISLRTKTFILIILTAAIVSAVGIATSSRILRQVVDDTYKSDAIGISRSVAAVLNTEAAASLRDAVMNIYDATEEKITSEAWDTPEFDAYIARYSEIAQSDEYLTLQMQLRSIQDVNEVDCIYLITVDPVLEHVIYLVDGAYEDACPPGCIDPLYEENMEIKSDPTIGFPPYITDTEPYGWLVTAAASVYDEDENVICYAAVDISMDLIRAQERRYILLLCGVLAALTVLVCFAAIWGVNRSIVRPINRLSSAMANYDARNESNLELDNLKINTGDEVQSLYESCRHMTHDIQGYIENLITTTQELRKARIEADEMNVLAHRDPLTGVGSKLAYDGQVAKLTEEMRQGNAQYGIVMVDMNGLKQLNDTYGHEKGNIAIQRTCSAICDVFAHSPVYRFGGDEFVVVIKGRDYDSVEERIRQFEELTKKSTGEPWERVNAAIGYARYDFDDTVDDVFRRADHIMYEQKKEIKNNQRV